MTSAEADPVDLAYVGPVTAAVIEDAPFDATDIPRRTVSYTALLEAGVNPGVAAKLRREYSLVWSFEWLAGANQICQEKEGTLDPELSPLIVVNDSPDRETSPSDRLESASLEKETPKSPNIDETGECERCGGALAEFQLGETLAIQCEDCGYVGIPTRP